jgi:hypothetical protein
MLKPSKKLIPLGIFLVAAAFAFFSIHIRIKTTLLGYQIGRLKGKESKLLKENSLLTMELAKIRSKKWLLNFLAEGQKNDKKL